MGSSSSKNATNTELAYQVKNARALRESLKALQKSITESNETLSAAPRRVLHVADGFTQVNTCASHASPVALTGSAGSPLATLEGSAPQEHVVPDSTVAVDRAYDFTEAMRACETEHTPGYTLSIERDVGSHVKELIALAVRCVQDGKTAESHYRRLTEARGKVESVESSARKKGKDVTTMSKYTQACSARSTAEANFNSHGTTFRDSYRLLITEVMRQAPPLMQQYARLTITYQRNVATGLVDAAGASSQQTGSTDGVNLNQTRPAQPLNAASHSGPTAPGVPMCSEETPAVRNINCVSSPYTNPSGPTTRGPSAPLDDDTPRALPTHVKEEPALPPPTPEQANDVSDLYRGGSHEPITTAPATRVSRSTLGQSEL